MNATTTSAPARRFGVSVIGAVMAAAMITAVPATPVGAGDAVEERKVDVKELKPETRASSSASVSASSSSSSRKGAGCEASARASSVAVAGDERREDHDEKHVSDAGENCSAKASSRASATSGDKRNSTN